MVTMTDPKQIQEAIEAHYDNLALLDAKAPEMDAEALERAERTRANLRSQIRHLERAATHVAA